jgi:hypothetical protein
MRTFAAAALLLSISTFAKAETVTALLTSVDPFMQADLYNNGTTINNDVVGELVWNGAGQGNSAPFDGTFTTFCLDLVQSISTNNVIPYTLTLQPALDQAPKAIAGGPMGSFKSLEMKNLYALHFSGLSTTDDLQAFQLSIWNILYDTDTQVDSGSGTFYVIDNVDGTAIAEADAWLGQAFLAANTLSGPFQSNVDALIGDVGVQDQIVPGPTAGSGVPIPKSALSGGALIAGLGLARILRSRSAARRSA